MKKELIILASGWILFLIFLLYQIRKSPEGYEKDGKFHYGKEQLNKENNKHD